MAMLDGDEWRRVQALFDELLDRAPADRAKRIARAELSAAGSEQLHALLDAAGGGGILDRPVPPIASESEAAPPSLAAGDTVGGFTVQRLIGRGGMGEVYLAHRTTDDFDQRVALKLLRIEAAERADLFDRERRTLARLDHPGIARLIDGGIARDGRPYMAIDYIEGAPIDDWCTDHRADLDTRLRLFREVCDAVAYAHANLVVHRDLKPSNILVDRAGHVRLLDFGIARLLEEDGASVAQTLALLTPDYAAPEQLGGEPSTVATDVHALGAVLFELLVGTPPWRRDGASVPTIVRRILHDDPPSPSRIATTSGTSPVVPSHIAGDLDAIVLKALRRDPADRYPGVIALADDIDRHRRVEPVRARSGSRRYLVGRFVRRNRWGVAAAAAALLALLVGAGGIAWQARRTAIERDVALAQLRRSDATTNMLSLMFRDARGGGAAGEVTAKQMLDDTAKRLVASVDTSAESALLITTIAELYSNIEDPAGADALVQAAIAKGIGRDDPVADARLRLRLAGTAATMNRTDDVAPLLAVAERVFAHDPERFRLENQEAVSVRAQLLKRTGDADGAIRLLTASLPEAERVYVGADRDLLIRYNNLLAYLLEANRLDEMRPVLDRAEATVARTRQGDSMAGLSIRQLRGVYVLRNGDPKAAERVFAEVVARRRAAFGKSAALGVDLVQLGRVKLAGGDATAAAPLLVEALDLTRTHLGPESLPTVVTALMLAEARAEMGDGGAARAVIADYAGGVAKLGAKGPVGGIAHRVRAIIALRAGDRATARGEAAAARAIFTSLGPAGASYIKGLDALDKRIG